MTTTKALRLHSYGGRGCLQLDDAPAPEIKEGQVEVLVKACGINQLDWKIREGYLKESFPLPLPYTLGVEFAGTVERGGSKFKKGDRVMGITRALGAYAESIAVDEALLAKIPDGLSDVEAGALPISVLTAHRAVHCAGSVKGKKILVHGAAGAVGSLAVQFAKAEGATVYATASASSKDHVESLGADRVIDYQSGKFEDNLKDIDLVLDFVGGDVLERSWSVLRLGGTTASASAPQVASTAPEGMHGVWLDVKPDPSVLEKVAQDVAAGKIKSTILKVFDLPQILDAVDLSQKRHAPGKIVVDFTRN